MLERLTHDGTTSSRFCNHGHTQRIVVEHSLLPGILLHVNSFGLDFETGAAKPGLSSRSTEDNLTKHLIPIAGFTVTDPRLVIFLGIPGTGTGTGTGTGGRAW